MLLTEPHSGDDDEDTINAIELERALSFISDSPIDFSEDEEECDLSGVPPDEQKVIREELTDKQRKVIFKNKHYSHFTLTWFS